MLMIMNTFDVPFVNNPDDKCVPATIGMVLAYFMPEKPFTMAELENLTGYQHGRGTWRTKSMLSLHNLGFQTKWIEDFDYDKFIESPKGYLRTMLDADAYRWQVQHSDLELEAKRVQAYLDAGNEITHRAGTPKDIKGCLRDGWLVSLEVNACPLAGKPGYEGHSVLVIGCDDQDVTIHNPDGVNGNKPHQVVGWEVLQQAWGEFGGSYSLFAFKK